MRQLAADSGPAGATDALAATVLQGGTRMSPNTPQPLPQPRITQTHAVTELVQSQRARAPHHRPHFAREQLHAPSLSLNSAATKFGSNATAPARSDTRCVTVRSLISTCRGLKGLQGQGGERGGCLAGVWSESRRHNFNAAGVATPQP